MKASVLSQQAGGVAAGLGHDPARQAVGLLQQTLEQVLHLHDLLLVALGDVGRVDDRLPRLFRELILAYAFARAATAALG